jgi:hypothetical protein
MVNEEEKAKYQKLLDAVQNDLARCYGGRKYAKLKSREEFLIRKLTTNTESK